MAGVYVVNTPAAVTACSQRVPDVASVKPETVRPVIIAPPIVDERENVVVVKFVALT